MTAGTSRRKRKEGGRPHRVTVRLSPEELQLLQNRAEQAKVSLPRLLIETALAGDVQTAIQHRALVAEFLGARRLLAAVSNNLNQLTRVANGSHELPAELPATLEMMSRTAERLDAATSALQPS